jgi:hypothetical protein
MFKYISQLEKDKLVFYGIAANNIICIKFIHQYSKEAHLKCSSLRFAPPLLGFESLPGRWFMVVMDFVDDQYELLDDSPVKASFLSEV